MTAVWLSVSMFAAAGDAQLNERRAKAADYESQADWKLRFVNWDTMAVYGPPQTNGTLVTIDMTNAKDITAALALAPAKKDQAVVVVSPGFHDHYAKDEGDKQLDMLAEKIAKAGFKRIVFLSEAAAGNFVMRQRIASPDAALQTADAYLKDNKTDVSRHDMSKPESIQEVTLQGQKAWRVSWRLKNFTGKGGQLVVIVTESGTCSQGWGE